jgi:hypothetical protein
MTHTEARDVAGEGLDALDRVEGSLDLLMHQETVGRQNQSPTIAVKKFKPDIALQLRKEPACRRLAQAVLAGRGGDRTQADDRAENP